MKRKLLFSILSLMLSIGICAQSDAVLTSGHVVTHNDTILGEVSLNMERNDLMIRSGRNIYNWTADKVKSATTLDQQTGLSAKYLTGAFGMNSNSFFFEVLSEGKMTLIYREGLKFAEHDEMVYPPFYTYDNGVIHSLPINKKEFLNLFEEEYAAQMAEYFKFHQVDLSDKEDIRKIVEFYNSKFTGGASMFVTNKK
ncbi:hypothetical protein N6H18_11395 [Reichenbachiella agarivorans]|uniref:DUF4468 domain-containing protein n=1 Tax=Reichenbachiella agarivorans TaxID=2979464 RepID=A0ABY6CKA7_9BACT|nr:hypothetical protein [Reichenbachiella agarivorans]UXP30954.1 hypothetical protein N6H18_11395 [Reichenbachiella agarivorans]